MLSPLPHIRYEMEGVSNWGVGGGAIAHRSRLEPLSRPSVPEGTGMLMHSDGFERGREVQAQREEGTRLPGVILADPSDGVLLRGESRVCRRGCFLGGGGGGDALRESALAWWVEGRVLGEGEAVGAADGA